jgi:hypothetical protein
MDEKARRAKRGRGAQEWYQDLRRNIGFTYVIAVVGQRFQLAATRNDASKGLRDCASSIVADASKRRHGLKISESRLEEIWTLYGDDVLAMISAWHAWPELVPHLPLGTWPNPKKPPWEK